MAVMDVRPMLSVEQIASTLSLHPSTVRRLAAAGELRAVRVGRQLRFPADAIDALPAPTTTTEKTA